jgi:hypothetical protein
MGALHQDGLAYETVGRNITLTLTLTLTLVSVHRMESGSNTSTVALRVVGGEEKGTQCLGNINTGTWPSRLGKSRI